MKVYRDGIEYYTIKDYKQTGRFMEVACIDCTVKSPSPLGFQIGDYVIFDYNNLKYTLYDIPVVKKQARKGAYGEAFIYELKFKADTQQLVICPFLDIVEGDNKIHFTSLPSFSTFENVYGIVKRIQANLDSLYPNQWRIEVAETNDEELLSILSDAREFSVSGETCFDGCKKIYDIWGVSYLHTVDNGINVITFGKSGEHTSTFKYGKGQGLKALKRNLQNTDELSTRIYAYGSTRNLPARWYNDKGYIGESQYIPNLMLPPSMWKDGKPQGAYIDAIIEKEQGDTITVEDRLSLYGLRPKIFYYDGSDNREEIYPSIEKLTAKNIRDAKADLNDTELVPSIQLYPDDERMDFVLEGSSISDDGTTTDSNYTPYSEKMQVALPPFEIDYIHASVPDSQGNYNLFDFEKSHQLCSFDINKSAKYRIDAIGNLFTIRKNDVYSNITFECYIETPLGQFISIYTEKIPTRDRHANIGLPESYISLDAIGTYKLFAKITVKWPSITTGITPTVDDELSLGDDFRFLFSGASNGNISLVLSRGYSVISSSFNIKIKQIGFDIDSVVASNGATKTIHFKSGMCAGRSFEIIKCSKSVEDDSWVLTCRRSDDSELSQRFPNSIFPIAKDDQFILLNINMPDLYIYTAMYRLYDAAYRDMLYYSKPQYLIEPEVDNFQIARSKQVLREGMYMSIEDRDLILFDDVLIDSVTITNKGTELRTFEVALRNEKPINRLTKLSERVSSLETSNSESNTEANRKPAKDASSFDNFYDLSQRLSAIENIIGIDANKDVFIKEKEDGTPRNFYAFGEITAGGDSNAKDSRILLQRIETLEEEINSLKTQISALNE